MASSRPAGCALGLLAVVVIGVLLLRFFVARAMIYPGSPVEFPADLERRLPGARLLRYQAADGAPLAGALLRSADPAGPVAVYFHGNAESAAQGLLWAGTLVRHGIGVFLPEVRGFGGIPGRTTEKHPRPRRGGARGGLHRGAGGAAQRVPGAGRAAGGGDRGLVPSRSAIV